MKHYFVTWTIDIYAETPRQAAEQALAIQRNQESTATVFGVQPDGEDAHSVDLMEPEEV